MRHAIHAIRSICSGVMKGLGASRGGNCGCCPRWGAEAIGNARSGRWWPARSLRGCRLRGRGGAPSHGIMTVSWMPGAYLLNPDP